VKSRAAPMACARTSQPTAAPALSDIQAQTAVNSRVLVALHGLIFRSRTTRRTRFAPPPPINCPPPPLWLARCACHYPGIHPATGTAPTMSYLILVSTSHQAGSDLSHLIISRCNQPLAHYHIYISSSSLWSVQIWVIATVPRGCACAW
jgi:hypothetical protein